MDRQHAESKAVKPSVRASDVTTSSRRHGRPVALTTPASLGALQRANDLATVATGRIARATHDLGVTTDPEPQPSEVGGEIIRRRVDTDWPTFDADAAQAAKAPYTRHVDYLRYVSVELGNIIAAYAQLPGGVADGVKMWGKTVAAELRALDPAKNAAAPTALQLQTWRVDYLDVLVDMVNDLDDQGQAIAARLVGDGADDDDGEAPVWTDQAGDFVAASAADVQDFQALIAALDPGSIYTRAAGSIVGGRKGKPVDGLNDDSARIDAQTPIPVDGLFNIQFQVGGKSRAGVLFAADDAEATIIAEFTAALQAAANRVSPSFTLQRGAPQAKVKLSKKQKKTQGQQNKSKK